MSEVMTPSEKLMTVTPKHSVLDVMVMMNQHNFRHVPVVSLHQMVTLALASSRAEHTISLCVLHVPLLCQNTDSQEVVSIQVDSGSYLGMVSIRDVVSDIQSNLLLLIALLLQLCRTLCGLLCFMCRLECRSASCCKSTKRRLDALKSTSQARTETLQGLLPSKLLLAQLQTSSYGLYLYISLCGNSVSFSSVASTHGM